MKVHMDQNDFLDKFKSAVGLPSKEKIEWSDSLESIPSWDSLSVVAVIAMLDVEYGYLSSADKIKNCKTVGDLAKLAESNNA